MLWKKIMDSRLGVVFDEQDQLKIVWMKEKLTVNSVLKWLPIWYDP